MRHLAPVLASTVLLAACAKEEGPITGAAPPEGELVSRVLLAGTVEKGPLVDGTVAIGAAAGGEAVVTEIQNALGAFAAWVPAAPVYRLEARGRAYRETDGAVAAEPVVLRALHVVGEGEGERFHVNVLTHLAHDRALALSSGGIPLAEAIGRADGEVHRALGIGAPFYRPAGPATRFSMLGADDDDHAYALAAAAPLDRAAGEDLPGFLAALAEDLADDGALGAELSARIEEGWRALDAAVVSGALRSWLAERGYGEVVVPDLRRMVDGDGNGVPDVEEPVAVDPARLSVVRHGLDRRDEAVGEAGAIAGGCRPLSVELFDRENGAAPLARGDVASDGSFVVPFGTPDASRPRLWLEARDGCGSRAARVAIERGVDETPPTIDGAAFSVSRHARGQADVVVAAPGAVVDPGGAVAAVWITDGRDGPRVAVAVPGPDGGVAGAELGTATSSYPLPWVEATDKAGNVSSRVEIAVGAAPELPSIVQDRVEVIRGGLGAFDQVLGDPGAVAGTCRPVDLRIYEAEDGEPLRPGVGDDGSFPPTRIGDHVSTPPRLWAEVDDKCGRTGERVEISAARDLEPPVIDPERLLFVADGDEVAVLGLPGALQDESGVVRVRIYRDDCTVWLRDALVVDPDGSFSGGNPGGDFVDPVFCVGAEDKAGNRSEPVRNRRVRALLDARSRGSYELPELALFSAVLDVDPRTVSPGYVPWVVATLGPETRADFAAGQALDTRAEPEIEDVPLAWRGIEFPIPPGYVRSIEWNAILQEATLHTNVDTGLSPLGAVWRDGAWLGMSGGYDFAWPDRTVVVDTHRYLRLDLGRDDDGGVVATSERLRGTIERLPINAPAWPEGVIPTWVFDAARARTVGVGGGESWALGEVDFGYRIHPYARLGNAPPGAVQLSFDPVRGRVVAYDGGSGTWELHGEAWAFTAPAPAECPGGHLVFDPVAGALVKFGGGGCDRICRYDGTWSCGEERVPEADLFAAADVAEGTLVAHGAGSRTWVREGAVPHRRHAVQALAVQLAAGVVPESVGVAVEATGVGIAADGSQVEGFEVLAWDWGQEAWVSLGTSSAAVFHGALAAVEPYLQGGALRFLLVPLGSSGTLSSQRATLSTRSATVTVDYRLPGLPLGP
jgi:hypothetical protein